MKYARGEIMESQYYIDLDMYQNVIANLKVRFFSSYLAMILDYNDDVIYVNTNNSLNCDYKVNEYCDFFSNRRTLTTWEDIVEVKGIRVRLIYIPVNDSTGHKLFTIYMGIPMDNFNETEWAINMAIIDVSLKHPDAIVFIKDTDLRYQFVNIACCKLLNVHYKHIVGKTYSEVVKSKSLFPLEKELMAINRNEIVTFREQIMDAFVFYDYQMEIIPITFRNSDVVGIACIVRIIDIEQESESVLPLLAGRIQSILDDVGVFYYEFSNFTNLTQTLSKNILSVFGMPIVEDGNMAIEDFIFEDDLELWKTNTNQLMCGDIDEYNIQIRLKKEDGTYHWFLNRMKTISRTKNDKPIFSVGVFISIHDLVLAREEAEAATQSKAIFLANTSHEIRTPLNGILGFSELLRKTPLNLKQENYLNNILQATKNLLVIINDILDLSKVESGKLELNVVNCSLKNVLNNINNIFKLEARKNKLKFSMSIDKGLPDYVHLDCLRVNQILMNLCSNAVKFTEKGSISVSVSYGKEKLLFKIRDTGIGMDEEMLQNVFTSYTQAGLSKTRKYGDIGLGLSISKQLAELMKGSLKCSSKKNKGTVFTLSIPYEVADVKKLINSYSDIITDVKLRNHNRILLVEDLKMNQVIITENLCNLGFEVDIAENGVECIETIKSNQSYDLILMDILMPEMDGFETARIIREELKLEKLPIIGLTADAMKDTQEKMKETGYTDYLLKPFEVKELYRKLIEYLDPRVVHESKAEKINHIDMDRLSHHLNVNEAVERWGGNLHLYEKLLISFAEDYSKGIELDSFNNQEELIRCFFNLKGLSANIGAGIISTLADHVITEIKTQNLSIHQIEGMEDYLHLEEEFQTLIDIIKSAQIIDE